jgi:hypothetical protein
MEVPGRDVTADALGPDDPTTEQPAAEAAGRDEHEGVTDKVKEAVEKVKDAVTPDDR